MKKLNDQLIIGVDHGYGNIFCKGIFNPKIWISLQDWRGNTGRSAHYRHGNGPADVG